MITIELLLNINALKFLLDFFGWIREYVQRVIEKHQQQSNVYQGSLNKDQNARNGTTRKAEHDILVAIDIGTGNMGYAILFRQRKDTVYTAKHGTTRRMDREPTAILFNADSSLDSIGYKAVDRYVTSAGDMSHSRYLLRRHFKMKIFQHAMCKSDNVDQKGLEELIMHTVQGLKEKAIDTIANIKNCDKSSVENGIDWIITTPLLKRNVTKDIMSQGVKKAYPQENRVLMVPESSSAARISRHHQLQVLDNETTLMSVGETYIICDIGAGKIDTCVLEICDGGRLFRRFRKFNPIGGHSVNENFVTFIKETVGPSIWKEFLSDENYYDSLQLLDQFEEKKIEFDNETEYIILTIPLPLLEIVGSNDRTLKELIESMPNVFLTSSDKLVIKREKIKEFFQPSLNALLQDLRDVRQRFTVQDLSKLVLVGGYSESEYIRQNIADENLSFDIALMQDPQMAVLKGALLLGLESRKLQY